MNNKINLKDTNIMYWYLFFVLFIFLISLPIKTKTVIKGNILNLSAQMHISLFKFNIVKLKVKINGGFVYITKGKWTYKEKLTSSNINLVFLFNFLKELYFRTQLLELTQEADIGYKDNAMTTSLLVSGLDIVSKGILCKVKNNKKYSHIFINNSAKYDSDCLIFKLQTILKINIFDVIYSFISSKLKSKGVKYERTKQREQSENIN